MAFAATKVLLNRMIHIYQHGFMFNPMLWNIEIFRKSGGMFLMNILKYQIVN